MPQFGPRIPAETLRRFWTMLAHSQGGLLNARELARGARVTARRSRRYLDLLVDLLLVRRLRPWHGNVGKRLVKSPKVYVRDSGLVHALLGIEIARTLLGHPVVGRELGRFRHRERCSPRRRARRQPFFYRTAAGAEIDLCSKLPGRRRGRSRSSAGSRQIGAWLPSRPRPSAAGTLLRRPCRRRPLSPRRGDRGHRPAPDGSRACRHGPSRVPSRKPGGLGRPDASPSPALPGHAGPGAAFRPGGRGLPRHPADAVGPIRQLEEELGGPLVERGRRFHGLTAEGQPCSPGPGASSASGRRSPAPRRCCARRRTAGCRLGVIPSALPVVAR